MRRELPACAAVVGQADQQVLGRDVLVAELLGAFRRGVISAAATAAPCPVRRRSSRWPWAAASSVRRRARAARSTPRPRARGGDAIELAEQCGQQVRGLDLGVPSAAARRAASATASWLLVVSLYVSIGSSRGRCADLTSRNAPILESVPLNSWPVGQARGFQTTPGRCPGAGRGRGAATRPPRCARAAPGAVSSGGQLLGQLGRCGPGAPQRRVSSSRTRLIPARLTPSSCERCCTSRSSGHVPRGNSGGRRRGTAGGDEAEAIVRPQWLRVHAGSCAAPRCEERA